MTESGNRAAFRILVVEDNDTLREGMTAVLEKEGYDVRAESDGAAALRVFEERPADLVITDFRMAGMDGLALLGRIKALRAETEVMMVTAFGTVDLAVEAMKAGAWDFLPKPFSGDALKLKADRVFRIVSERRAASRLADENLYLRDEFIGRVGENGIVGRSDRMRAVFADIRKIASSDSSVLIFGESGTGKELVARAVHERSGRSAGPFIRVACGALAEGILESELFGHEKGAFTGAVKQTPGKIEVADGGTCLLYTSPSPRDSAVYL
ncbi:MAG: sigma 54-interacting transcriptional regulator, partial [bacterium]|nr:sigma 54-interacting transcriptional regulator [bacterium]